VIYFNSAIASAEENKLLMDFTPAGRAVEPSRCHHYHGGYPLQLRFDHDR
jgi:hypothetical protein